MDKQTPRLETSDAAARAVETSKRPYRQPELLEWGSIVDLTAGGLNAPGDFPFGGGTRPEFFAPPGMPGGPPRPGQPGGPSQP